MFIHSHFPSISAAHTLKYLYCLQTPMFFCPRAEVDLSREMDTPSERSKRHGFKACVPAVDTGTQALRGSAQGLRSRKRLKHAVSLKSRSRPRTGQHTRQMDEISRSRFARHMTRPRLAQNNLTKSSRVRLISGLSWSSGCDTCESTMSAKISTCFAGLNPPPTWDPGCVSGDRNEHLTQA